MERILTDNELEKLNYSFNLGEVPFCEALTGCLLNHYESFDLDDNGEREYEFTLHSLWNMQRASQVHNWYGAENTIYEELKRLVLSYLKLELKIDKIVYMEDK